jgi:hypothetical protein
MTLRSCHFSTCTHVRTVSLDNPRLITKLLALISVVVPGPKTETEFALQFPVLCKSGGVGGGGGLAGGSSRRTCQVTCAKPCPGIHNSAPGAPCAGTRDWVCQIFASMLCANRSSSRSIFIIFKNEFSKSLLTGCLTTNFYVYYEPHSTSMKVVC